MYRQDGHLAGKVIIAGKRKRRKVDGLEGI
jgi:hypothetical protein